MSITCFKIHFSKCFLYAGEYAEIKTNGLGAAAGMQQDTSKTIMLDFPAIHSTVTARVSFQFHSKAEKIPWR